MNIFFDRQCIFCGQLETSILSVNNSMNSHYWRSCPMLTRCQECSQVVEISALIDHLLVECEKHEKYVQCPDCSEAIKTEMLQQHSTTCTGKLYVNLKRCHPQYSEKSENIQKHCKVILKSGIFQLFEVVLHKRKFLNLYLLYNKIIRNI